MTKKAKVYLDTSVISALFDKRTPERKILTENAWEMLIDHEVYISELVLDELGVVSEEMRNKFLAVISNFFVLKLTEEVEQLAREYIKFGIFPEKYYDDALHVAFAAINEIDYLMSWNFKHLVKVKTRKLVALVNAKENYRGVEIIAPPEL